MNVLIMAQGKATRFPGKHFAKVNGEAVIARTVRMIREMEPDSSITIVAYDSAEFRELGCNIYQQPDPGDGLMTGLHNTQKLWSRENTVILLGDVVFSRFALDRILHSDRRLAFYGRTGRNRYTGCSYGEIFGLVVHAEFAKRVLAELATRELRIFSDGRLWGLRRHLSERAQWCEIDDWTDDVDTPDDQIAVQRVLDNLTYCIVTCKGRLDHLKITLPLLAKEFDAPTDTILHQQRIVVDYDCPNQSGRWVHHEGLGQVKFVQNEPHFHKTRALNIGAQVALQHDARWLCFMDADTVVHAGLRAELGRIAGYGPKAVAFGPPHAYDLVGFLLVSRELFQKVGGYDEGFEGWGFEDVDMRLRLLVDAGAEPYFVTSLSSIGHPQELRERFSRLPYKEALEKNRARFHQHLAETANERPPGFKEYVERWLGKDLGK